MKQIIWRVPSSAAVFSYKIIVKELKQTIWRVPSNAAVFSYKIIHVVKESKQTIWRMPSSVALFSYKIIVKESKQTIWRMPSNALFSYKIVVKESKPDQPNDPINDYYIDFLANYNFILGRFCAKFSRCPAATLKYKKLDQCWLFSGGAMPVVTGQVLASVRCLELKSGQQKVQLSST